MGRMGSRRAARLLATLMSWLVAVGTLAAAPYKVAEFHSGADYFGLNNRGQVFGSQIVDDRSLATRAIVFDSLGTKQYTVPNSPVSTGRVSGTSQDLFVARSFYDGSGRPAVYNAETGESAFVNVPRSYSNVVSKVDDAGRLYGHVLYPHNDETGVASHSRPFVVENGEARDLTLPQGMRQGTLVDVNASGEVLIQAGSPGGAMPDAFVLRDGGWHLLGSLQATGINDKGDVVGNARTADDWFNVHPVLIPADGSGPVALNEFPGAQHTYIRGINSRGEIVGGADLSAVGRSVAFVYRDGIATDLNTLIDRTGSYGELNVRYITAINDLGQILAKGDDGDHWINMLLSPSELDAAEGSFAAPIPVPEPSTLLIFGGMALGVGLARRGRRG